LSLLLAIALATAVAPILFSGFIGYPLSITSLIKIEWWIFLVGGALFLGVVTGLYPAFMMSSVKATHALKRKMDKGVSLGGIRKGLVVIQFTISAVLLSGLLIIDGQNNYIQTKALGFNRDHTLAITLSDRSAQENYLVLKNQLLQESFVKNACVSATIPTYDGFYAWAIKPEGYDGVEMNMKTVNTDEDFISTYGIDMVSGRDFDKNILTDREEAFILNEAAAKQLNWEDPIGKTMELTFYTDKENVRKGKVIGVVKDFHFQTLYNRIEPLIIFINTHPYYADYITVNLAPGNIHDQLSRIETIWKDYNQDKPLEFSFLDDNLNHLYQKEQRTNTILSLFTLFGLLSISLERRTKEIGIRKVLGSSSIQIMKLVSRELVTLIIIANILAAPISMLAARDWLSRFAYHIDLGILPLVISGLALVLIAIITISGKVIKASLTNPVTALRQE
jgi:putative ABC transport system permease protein